MPQVESIWKKKELDTQSSALKFRFFKLESDEKLIQDLVDKFQSSGAEQQKLLQ